MASLGAVKRLLDRLLDRIFVSEPPKPEKGFSVWCEDGIWHTAPIVDPDHFGPHRYDITAGGDCSCGCWMALSSSGGPVDPFGACPDNPKGDK